MHRVKPPEDMETIRNQGKSMAAENAIKLTVYQTDSVEGDEPFETPKQEAQEPVKQQSKKKSEEEPAEEVSDLVKKWAKK